VLKRVAREISDGYAAVAGRTVDFMHQPLGQHIDPNGLGGYYCDFRHKAEHTEDDLPRDGHGDPDWWVIPIAQAALGFWELRMEGRSVDRQFMRLVEWLMTHVEPSPVGGKVWRVEKPSVKYGLPSGWSSAMAQGEVASVLLRAHALTGDDVYLETAKAAFPPMTVPVARGGLQNDLDGALVLEEYPTQRPTAVLNGWLFALYGVHELATAAEMPEARELFERSAADLVRLLPRYDNGWWSLYSLQAGEPDLSKPFYQRLHPVLLEALALIHPDPELDRYAQRWRDQLTKPALARASFNKIAFRLRRARAARRTPQPDIART
jgi:heparosan-N-sulfate-glucuronate 5-epimerase